MGAKVTPPWGALPAEQYLIVSDILGDLGALKIVTDIFRCMHDLSTNKYRLETSVIGSILPQNHQPSKDAVSFALSQL